MTLTLIRKLLRDVRVALVVVAFLLGAFQCLWYKVTERIIGQLSPFFNTLASLGGLTNKDIQNVLFEGPGKIIRTIIGGEQIDLDGVMDMLSIGYVHPLSLWAGSCLGYWLIGPVQLHQPELKVKEQKPTYLIELGPLRVGVKSPVDLGAKPKQPAPGREERARRRLEVRLLDFGPALPVVGGLIFAVSGYTMWLSAMGRFRWRVLGIAVLVTLLQFLINVIGQMWEVAAPLRPLTIFYYYQPQKVILGQGWTVDFAVWNGGEPLARVPMLLVLYGVGLVGYALALRTFLRRDIPAPL